MHILPAVPTPGQDRQGISGGAPGSPAFHDVKSFLHSANIHRHRCSSTGSSSDTPKSLQVGDTACPVLSPGPQRESMQSDLLFPDSMPSVLEGEEVWWRLPRDNDLTPVPAPETVEPCRPCVSV